MVFLPLSLWNARGIFCYVGILLYLCALENKDWLVYDTIYSTFRCNFRHIRFLVSVVLLASAVYCGAYGLRGMVWLLLLALRHRCEHGVCRLCAAVAVVSRLLCAVKLKCVNILTWRLCVSYILCTFALDLRDSPSVLWQTCDTGECEIACVPKEFFSWC